MEMSFHFICSYFSQSYLLDVILFQNITYYKAKMLWSPPPPMKQERRRFDKNVITWLYNNAYLSSSKKDDNTATYTIFISLNSNVIFFWSSRNCVEITIFYDAFLSFLSLTPNVCCELLLYA